MGEAILSRIGAAYDANAPKLSWRLYTEIIDKNTSYTVPTCRNQSLTVMLFGAGGGKYSDSNNNGGGGGGGNMNKSVISIAPGTVVDITIGAATLANNGGTTSFGIYLSATGGEKGDHINGGNGGSGGGMSATGSGNWRGGTGLVFGGGGAALMAQQQQPWRNANASVHGGIGGIYGGQGGCVGYWGNGQSDTNAIIDFGNQPENSYGGHGGRIIYYSNNMPQSFEYPQNGISVDNVGSVLSINAASYPTSGLAGSTSNLNTGIAFGGGGGYGGCGGNGHTGSYRYASTYERYYCGGGGGGYCANGGNGGSRSNNSHAGGGGGGGYGSDGWDGGSTSNEKGGGGGGGGYGKSDYAHGASYNRNATDGVCIIQYYGIVYE